METAGPDGLALFRKCSLTLAFTNSQHLGPSAELQKQNTEAHPEGSLSPDSHQHQAVLPGVSLALHKHLADMLLHVADAA